MSEVYKVYKKQAIKLLNLIEQIENIELSNRIIITLGNTFAEIATDAKKLEQQSEQYEKALSKISCAIKVENAPRECKESVLADNIKKILNEVVSNE